MEIDISTGSITIPRIPDLDPDDYEWLRWRNRDKFEFYRKGQQWKEYVRELEQFGGEHKRQFPKLETTESCKITFISYSPRRPSRGLAQVLRDRQDLISLIHVDPQGVTLRPLRRGGLG